MVENADNDFYAVGRNVFSRSRPSIFCGLIYAESAEAVADLFNNDVHDPCNYIWQYRAKDNVEWVEWDDVPSEVGK